MSAIVDSSVQQRKNMHSLIVIKDDTIIYEYYKKGFTPRIPHNIKSASKSIVSLLAGIAIEKGYFSLDSDLGTIFDKKAKFDSVTSKVTIRQLLTMQAGFPDIGPRYYWIVCFSPDPIQSTVNKRRKIIPGVTTEYSDIGANLLGYAIAEASNMKLEDFAEKYLFSPLGITSDIWVTDLQGNNASAGDIFMCPRDLARIGYLMLHQGIINGRQIVSRNWIDESITAKTIIPHYSDELSYGYLWWIDNKMNNNAFSAIGHGGQFLYVSPEDKMVVVASSSLTGDGWLPVLEMIRTTVINRALE